ncbi:MAG: hypothetical protein ACHQ4G_04625 [Opitutales bacterium]
MAKRTPQDVLRRVLRVSAMNGWSVALFAGLCAVISLFLGQLVGAGIGVLVTIGGVMELRGRRLLQQRDIDGMRLLVRAQLLVLGVILVYAVSRLASFDGEAALGNETAEMRQLLNQSGIDQDELMGLIKTVFYAMYSAVIVATVIYQGGMALYYRRCTAAVRTAMTALPEVPPAPTA